MRKFCGNKIWKQRRSEGFSHAEHLPFLSDERYPPIDSNIHIGGGSGMILAVGDELGINEKID